MLASESRLSPPKARGRPRDIRSAWIRETSFDMDGYLDEHNIQWERQFSEENWQD